MEMMLSLLKCCPVTRTNGSCAVCSMGVLATGAATSLLCILSRGGGWFYGFWMAVCAKGWVWGTLLDPNWFSVVKSSRYSGKFSVSYLCVIYFSWLGLRENWVLKCMQCPVNFASADIPFPYVRFWTRRMVNAICLNVVVVMTVWTEGGQTLLPRTPLPKKIVQWRCLLPHSERKISSLVSALPNLSIWQPSAHIVSYHKLVTMGYTLIQTASSLQVDGWVQLAAACASLPQPKFLLLKKMWHVFDICQTCF